MKIVNFQFQCPVWLDGRILHKIAIEIENGNMTFDRIKYCLIKYEKNGKLIYFIIWLK